MDSLHEIWAERERLEREHRKLVIEAQLQELKAKEEQILKRSNVSSDQLKGLSSNEVIVIKSDSDEVSVKQEPKILRLDHRAGQGTQSKQSGSLAHQSRRTSNVTGAVKTETKRTSCLNGRTGALLGRIDFPQEGNKCPRQINPKIDSTTSPDVKLLAASIRMGNAPSPAQTSRSDANQSAEPPIRHEKRKRTSSGLVSNEDTDSDDSSDARYSSSSTARTTRPSKRRSSRLYRNRERSYPSAAGSAGQSLAAEAEELQKDFAQPILPAKRSSRSSYSFVEPSKSEMRELEMLFLSKVEARVYEWLKHAQIECESQANMHIQGYTGAHDFEDWAEQLLVRNDMVKSKDVDSVKTMMNLVYEGLQEWYMCGVNLHVIGSPAARRSLVEDWQIADFR